MINNSQIIFPTAVAGCYVTLTLLKKPNKKNLKDNPKEKEAGKNLRQSLPIKENIISY